VGQDLVCLFSEKFPEEVKIRKVVSKFPRRNGWPYII
jgi:hypothetical protein